MKITHLFIDFDNTLMDTESVSIPPLVARFNSLYRDSLKQPLTVEIFAAHFHGLKGKRLSERLSDFYHIPVDYEILFEDRERLMQACYQALPQGVQMAPNVVQTLSACREHGISLSLVTNNPLQRAFAAMRFSANGEGRELAHLFDANFFEANPIEKPDPDVYQRAIAQTDAATQTSLAIEDSVTGLKSALGAGLKTIGYVGLSQQPEVLKQKLLDNGCHEVIDDWQVLLDILNA